MRESSTDVPTFPGSEPGQPSNADLMAKLDRMMGAMALKEDVQIAQMEVIKQMRSELSSQIEPLRAQVVTTADNVRQAREETKSLNSRLAPVERTVAELSSGQTTLSDRVSQIEAKMSVLNIQGLERMNLKLMNSNDPAFRQIAILGFKGGSADERIRAVKEFATSEFGRDVQVQVSNEEKGPRNKRELTETTLMNFIDNDARDAALKLLEKKYPKSENGFGVNVCILGTSLVATRARLSSQKARNWAFRKAFELVKLRASTEFSDAVVEYDWSMPIRKILVNGEAAFEQPKDSLRGSFVGAKFRNLELPA